MSARDVLGDFPSTHATWLATRIDDGGHAAVHEMALHLMERYRAPLVAYAAQSRLRNIDEPDELVHGFFAVKSADPRFLAEWRASGLPLRRWMLNGLVFHARGVMRDRSRETARRAQTPADMLPSSSVDAERAFERSWAFALVEAACRAAHASLTREGRGRAYDCFHRHFFDSVGYARLAADHRIDETTVASEIRLATRRTRTEAEAMLRDELGTADERTIAAELGRVRDLTGWGV
jgi:hypothetical protein